MRKVSRAAVPTAVGLAWDQPLEPIRSGCDGARLGRAGRAFPGQSAGAGM